MRPFFWRIVICLVPCLLCGLITGNASVRYVRGEQGGYKLGVDLVGGTILVYEIDMRKLEKGQFDSNKLAIALKRRIDPNDLYNITIRPAGGEGRVEIILPTGGVHREAKAKEAWDELLAKMKKKMEEKLKHKVQDLDVGRGNIQELADRIHIEMAEEIWSKELFGTPQAWRELLNNFWNKVPENFPSLLDPVDWPSAKADPESAASALAELGSSGPLSALASFVAETASRTRRTQTERVPVGNIPEFVRVVHQELAGVAGEKVIQTWIKDQAWDQLLARAQKRWPNLAGKMVSSDPLGKRAFGVALILPDSTDQLIGFIQTGGNLVAQGALASLDPLLGHNFSLATESAKGAASDAQSIAKFIEDNYGPSLQDITKEIDDLYRASGRSRDLAREDVQRIKDLVAKVGSLEFRILANNKDDAKGIEEAKKLLESTDPAMQQELKTAQETGLPPPGPRVKGSKTEPQIFEISLPRDNKSQVTYSWVELGPQERHTLGLDNASAFDPKRNEAWLEMAKARSEGKAITITDPHSAKKFSLLQGALFFSRKCEDRNLPEEERRQKAYEYFVLARDPEIDSRKPANLPLEQRRTPKIGGNYLRNAMADMHDVRPAVSFIFNEEGGSLFGDLTRKNVPSRTGAEGTEVKRFLAIVLDGLIMSAPTINSEIRTHGQITGDFTKREVDALVNILRAGQLPASLKPQPVSESTMGATLGEDTIQAGVRAVGLAFLAVLVFMIFYYRFAGLVASVALLANLLLTIGFMVFVQATFTLPGLAGLVLMLGMAVDANVLIYERLREERDRGAGLALAIRNGYDRAFPTIIDTHLSSIFTAIVLYIVGNDQLKGFGVSLTAGLIISLFTSLYMTRLLFDIWQAKNWLHKLSMLRLFTKPDIDFMGLRYLFFTLTLALAVLGIVVFIGRLPNDLNIDFVGGTAYGGKLVSFVYVTDLRDLVDEKHQKQWLQVNQVKEEPGSDGTRFKITYQNPDKSSSAPREVLFANNVEPADEVDKDGKVTLSHQKEREAAVAERASHLPDPSVEQLFPSYEKPPQHDVSRYFNIRTSEKEPELVQAALDRLLRGKKRDWTEGSKDFGKEVGAVVPLMEKIFMFYEPLAATGTRLRFFEREPPKDFNPAVEAQKEEKQRFPASFASPSFIRTLLTRELLVAFDQKDKKDLPFHFDLIGEGKTKEGSYQVMRLKFSDPVKGAQRAKVEDALKRTANAFADQPLPDRLDNFDSQLASETRFRAMWAILASWGAIALYLWFRFGNWTFGLAAVLCLVHDLFFTLGIVAACHYVYATWFGQLIGLEDFKIDLPAVAALLTLVGYSVNDTIVVFDRIREVRGKNPDLTPQMINDSVNQTLSRTLLTSVTTWLVVFVLYAFGGPGVKLFAFVMVVGVIVGTYSSIYIASPLLLLFGEGTKETRRRRPAPAQVASTTA